MKKLVILVCVLSIFSLAFFASPARAVEISVSPSSVEVETGQNGRYNIQIYNDYPMSEELVITVTGPHLEWLNLGGYYTTIGGNSMQDIGLFFYPTLEGKYQYNVIVYAKDHPERIDSKAIELTVIPEKEFDVRELKSEITGTQLLVEAKTSSKSSRTVKIPFDVFDGNGDLVKHFEVTQQVSGMTVVSQSVELGELLAGNYMVKVEMPEFGVKAQSSFVVSAIHKVVTKRETVSTPLGQDVIITVTNEGNTPEDYVASDSVQANQYVGFVDTPASTVIDGSDVSYNWHVEGLAVGKSVSFVYNISRLPFVIGSFIMIFCLVAILGMGAVKIRAPSIKKSHVKKRNEHIIVLEIKGPVMSDLKNVIVKDRVTALGKVLPEFGGPKPVIRETEYGTELFWNLGDMKPRSQIYLSYKVQPLVEAQLKMPRAFLSYRMSAAENEGKTKVFSREVILE
ncbi:MAG: hypothetical protein V1648_02950 [Candidatus Aenigmatarchaeota archaeon]